MNKSKTKRVPDTPSVELNIMDDCDEVQVSYDYEQVEVW